MANTYKDCNSLSVCEMVVMYNCNRMFHHMLEVFHHAEQRLKVDLMSGPMSGKVKGHWARLISIRNSMLFLIIVTFSFFL